MNDGLQRLVSVATRGGRVIARRDFLRQASALGLAAGASNWTDVIAASANQLRRRGMACILLWMDGGPSQFETFSPKPIHDNGGPTKAIATNVAGVEYSENMPRCAAVADRLAVIRSLTSKEGNHQRATFLLHHGYLPMGGVKFPTLGANVAHQIGDAAATLPGYVRIGGRLANAGGGGFLGVQYNPLILQSASRPPQNTTPTTDADRFARRLRLLDELQNDYAGQGGAQIVDEQRQIVQRSSEMILSPEMVAFDIQQEPKAMRQAYGGSEFGAGCLMARRLIERGVTFVEVTQRGWDTHQDNFSRVAQQCEQVDGPTAQLVADLQQRGMLEKTLVVWMGEFGRTPRINPRDGRDHYPRAFNAVLAGGGVRGGQVIGRTDLSGSDIKDRPVSVNDLFQSIYHALGIDPDHENMSRIGRPIRLVDGGAVVEELFA